MSRVAARHARAQQPRRERALLVLLVTGIVLALGIATDLLAAPSEPGPAEPVAQPPARAGTWYCPAVAAEGEQTMLTVTAVGEEPSQVIVDRYGEGRAVPDDPVTLQPGQEIGVAMTDADAMAPAAVRWSGGPVAALWRVDGARTAAAPCEPAPSDRWYIPGFNTMLGSQATLHLFNPYTADAVVRVTFAEPEGRSAPVLTDNVLVSAGGTTSVNLRRFKPEEPDLGVVVEVLAGRVVAQGELAVTPPRGTSGAAGRVMLPGAPEPSGFWGFAQAIDEEGSESWLSVINPGDDAAAVEVRVSDPSADVLPEVSVPAGGIARIELAGVSSTPSFGVSVSVVNDQPVVVSRLTANTVGGTQALAGGLGASQAATEWALIGAGTGQRGGLISLYNPGAEPATVEVVAEGAPPEWSGITVGPNARVGLDLAAAGADRPSIPVRVRSDEPVVAEVRSTSAGENVRLWMTVGVPDRLWLGRATRPLVVRDPLLSTRRAVTEPDTTDIPLELDPVPTEQATATEPAPPAEGAASEAPPAPPS